MTTRVLGGLALVVAVGLVGCGDDAGGEDVATFCDRSREFLDDDESDFGEGIREMTGIAPEEISDDFELLVETEDLVADDPEAAAEVYGDEERVEELDEAAARIDAFLERECGIEIDG